MFNVSVFDVHQRQPTIVRDVRGRLPHPSKPRLQHHRRHSEQCDDGMGTRWVGGNKGTAISTHIPPCILVHIYWNRLSCGIWLSTRYLQKKCNTLCSNVKALIFPLFGSSIGQLMKNKGPQNPMSSHQSKHHMTVTP